ncbi:MAG: histidine kinase, partial [Pyrinomonadaceae bacterium]|nr:histidine kinase [Pyrinomonadaceae bacterium]
LLLRIADNGAGFDAASESEGQGLASMRRRALALGGALAVESRAGQGTSISLKVPRARFRRAATVTSA